MKFIEEVVVEEFLPTVRSMLAESLRERGLTQSEVAEALGISQSAVSKYAHGEVERNERVLDDERVQEVVETVADGLASGELSRVGALAEVEVLIRRLERGDLLAALHEDAMPELADSERDFDVHDPESDLRTTEQVLASLRRGLRTLERTRGVADLVPNVGSNLVECTPGARTIDDVAGVPGRLFEVKGRLAVPAEPEFGASEHVASVLLAARATGCEARAAFNLRYDPKLIERLEASGRVAAEFDAEYDDLDPAIARAFEETPGADVLYHTGGYGIEPIAYVLGEDAGAVVDVVRTLARR
jgi:predicted fused transcriptional regulator/phosphomethylpyrimidine kinase/predicted transcriptional regulator